MGLIEKRHDLEEIKKIVFSELKKNTIKKSSAMRNVILATGSDAPDLRYVVLREFLQNERRLYIYTDIRSNKIQQIKENKEVVVLAYHSTKKCQVKIKGFCHIHHQDELANKEWANLNGGKDSYNTQDAPGTNKKSIEAAQQMKQNYDDENFCVLTINIETMEVLQLDPAGHIRCFFDFTQDEAYWLVP